MGSSGLFSLELEVMEPTCQVGSQVPFLATYNCTWDETRGARWFDSDFIIVLISNVIARAGGRFLFFTI